MLAHGQSAATPPQDLRDLLEGSARIVDDPAAVVGPGWQEHADAATRAALEEHRSELEATSKAAQGVVQQAIEATARQYDLTPPTAVRDAAPTAARYRLYVSQSMGDAALSDAALLGEQHQDLHIILRGVKPGQTIMQLHGLLQKLKKRPYAQGDAVPQILIDPSLFVSAGVQSAPVLERIDDQGRVVAVVRGVMDIAWLERRINAGDTGDLGTRGQTFAVIEEDMLVALQKRAAEVDYASLKEGAAERYWKQASFVDLPAATTARARKIDPTVVVHEDVRTPDGLLIAKKGDRFNPLESVGFTQTLVIFDATRHAQVAFVATFLNEHPQERITLMATHVDRDAGWKGWAALEQKFRHAVFLLTPAVRDTFQLERVPTTVTADGTSFIVTEVPAHTGDSNAAADPSPR